MEKKDIKEILERYSSGEFTAGQEEMVRLWLFQLHEDDEIGLSELNLNDASHKIWARLQTITPQPAKVVKLWPRIVAVAAAVALIVTGVYFFNYNKQTVQENIDLVAHDVAPGKVGATLTLASGKKIRLTDALNGELANEAGISISKTADGQLVYQIKGSDAAPNKINTLSTAKGETYQVRLPDGSMVYLNAASSLTYAASLIERGKRMVRLRGEGYFEISKDKKHPFVVQTDKQEVEVLGTHFNVMAYPDEPAIATTLLEGSVKVTAAGKAKILKPNELALNNGKSIKVTEADVEEEMAWKNGYFRFNLEGIQGIMRKLSRWYNIDVEYQGKITTEKFTGTVTRDKNISQVLLMLEQTKDVQFKIEGRKVIVIP